MFTSFMMQSPKQRESTTANGSEVFPTKFTPSIEYEDAPLERRRRSPATAAFETVRSSLFAASINNATSSPVTLVTDVEAAC